MDDVMFCSVLVLDFQMLRVQSTFHGHVEMNRILDIKFELQKVHLEFILINSRKSKAKFTTRLLPIGVQTFDYCFAEEKISSLISWVKKHVMGIQINIIARCEKGKHSIFFFSTEFQNWVITLVKTNNVAMPA